MTSHRVPVEDRRGSMAPLARLPVFFELTGKPVLLAGGSAAAAWKAELLLAAGATLRVCAEHISEEMRAVLLPVGARAEWLARSWEAPDFNGVAMAIGAFEDDAPAASFAQAARDAGVPVNVIDRPAFCDFSFGAIVNRSPLVVGISTDGAAPVFAQMVRAKIEAMLPSGFALWAGAAKAWRSRLRDAVDSFAARRRFWQLFTSLAVQRPDAAPTDEDFSRLMRDLSDEKARSENGSVTLVGAGPGNPELLTLRAVRALQSADVILFDDLVSSEILDFARREARKMLVGKTGYGKSCKQADINALMISLAKSGRRVVRLKGGDPMLFGRAGEEIDACREAGILLEVVPGITAAQGAAASLSVSLTSRHNVRRVQYITGHASDGKLPENLHWQSVADPDVTTAIYMPTRTISAFVTNAMAAGLSPEMPAVIVSGATTKSETVVKTTIARLVPDVETAKLPGPVLVMTGRVFQELEALEARENALAGQVG